MRTAARTTPIFAWMLVVCAAGVVSAQETKEAQDMQPFTWTVEQRVLLPCPAGSFDETAVKDPSIVFADGRWHLFYTAYGPDLVRKIGWTSSPILEGLNQAPHAELNQIHSKDSAYAAAPQVFFFEPQSHWYLICQTRDSNYQPVFSTTTDPTDPASWTAPAPLVEKTDTDKWIDFWVLCDAENAYFFYTRSHSDVFAMTTPLDRFPEGFDNPQRVFGPVHEAVHVYKARGLEEYHMIYEHRHEEDRRSYGLAVAPHPLGPWTPRNPQYAQGDQLRYPPATTRWTDEVSHGELIRTGHNQLLEYDPAKTQFLIQGLLTEQHTGPYHALPWTIGLIRRTPSP